MRRRFRNVAASSASCLVWLAAQPAWAQNPTLNRTGSGARAAGMANAFVAVSDDGSAASWNPAGLAQLRKPELALVHTSIERSQRYQGFRSLDGRHAFTNVTGTYGIGSPEFASLAVPFDLFGKATTLQLDWRRQYFLSGNADFSMQRESLPDGARTPVGQTLDARGNIDQLSFALAMRLSRRISLGASVSHWYGDWQETFTVIEPRPDSGSEFVAERSQQRLRGPNLNLGLLFTYPSFNVGLVYHAPFEAPLGLAATLETSRGPATTLEDPHARLNVGKSFAAGVAWRPGGAWTLALDVTHDDWSRFTVRDCAACGPLPTNFFDGLPHDRTSTRDTTSINLGAEHLFTRGGHAVPIRFGLAFEPQGPMDPEERDPVDYLMSAVGAGYNTNSVKLDAALQYRWGRAHSRQRLGVDARLGETPPATGESTLAELRLKVSLIVRITNTDRLRRVLRRVLIGDDGEDPDGDAR